MFLRPPQLVLRWLLHPSPILPPNWSHALPVASFYQLTNQHDWSHTKRAYWAQLFGTPGEFFQQGSLWDNVPSTFKRTHFLFFLSFWKQFNYTLHAIALKRWWRWWRERQAITPPTPWREKMGASPNHSVQRGFTGPSMSNLRKDETLNLSPLEHRTFWCPTWSGCSSTDRSQLGNSSYHSWYFIYNNHSHFCPRLQTIIPS